MNTDQQKAILSVALLAAFADSSKDDREREQVRRLADSLANEENAPDMAQVYQDVLLKRVKIADAARALDDPAHRQFAYEMAVCVCDADGLVNDEERRFLADLKTALGLNAAQVATVEREAAALAEEPLPAPVTAGTVVVGAAIAGKAGQSQSAGQSGAVPTPTPGVSEAELDRSILNYSILNGALELLPQSWASMAIIPLQIKMVYRIGKSYGYELDKGHIKEFLGTVGVGLTSQYLEQIGRKLLGGLIGKAAGRMAGGLGRSATSVAFSFASTYALGQIAKRYYAGGRQMSAAMLQESFRGMLGPAKQLQAQYLPQIEQKAGTLDASQIMSLVRGA
ncbi:MAG: YcjF family protein [Burkholderiales bacterium]